MKKPVSLKNMPVLYDVFRFTIIFILILVIVVPLVVAEEADAFHRHHVALIVGNTQNDGSENGLSVGVDYAYRFNRWMSLGGLAEYAGGDFKHLLLLAGAAIHPHKNWLLVVAGGTEVHKDHDNHESKKLERDWIIRTGLAYQFPISDQWTINNRQSNRQGVCCFETEYNF